MCRVGIAALICATAVVGPLMAQDNVSTRTKTLLAAEWKETELGRPAKFYALTGEGRRQLERELQTWSRLSMAVQHVLHRA